MKTWNSVPSVYKGTFVIWAFRTEKINIKAPVSCKPCFRRFFFYKSPPALCFTVCLLLRSRTLLYRLSISAFWKLHKLRDFQPLLCSKTAVITRRSINRLSWISLCWKSLFCVIGTTGRWKKNHPWGKRGRRLYNYFTTVGHKLLPEIGSWIA